MYGHNGSVALKDAAGSGVGKEMHVSNFSGTSLSLVTRSMAVFAYHIFGKRRGGGCRESQKSAETHLIFSTSGAGDPERALRVNG